MATKFAPSTYLIRIAENLLLTMTVEQQVRPVVVAYENGILAKHQFQPAPEYREYLTEKLILDRKQSYLLASEDAKVFFAESFAARELAGLKVARADNCPLLEAESMRIDAENAFIEELGNIPGFDSLKSNASVMSLEQRAKLIDIGLRLVAPFVGKAEGILRRFIGS